MDDDCLVRLAVLEERIARIEKATLLQAAEYERRLHNLDSSYSREVREARIQHASFLHRDTYDLFVADTLRWREEVRAQLAERAGGIMTFREIAFRLIPVLISVGTVLYLLIKKII